MDNEILTSNLRGQRTIATVVFTDCVGFSARMSVDEDLTLDLIRRDLKLIKHLCDRLEGRVLKFTGDGLMMCFASAIQAVKCAIEVQETLTRQATELPPNQVLKHRIGIHVADMFITENDVMGNGVNIAARLQTQSEPGGICLSQAVYDMVHGKLSQEMRYLGPRDLKNIREVVPVYKVVLRPDPTFIEAQNDIFQQLQQHPELARIKKLLFYLCRQQWQSNSAQLPDNQIAELVNELYQRATSPSQLQQVLHQAVQTLSKKAEYTAISDILWETLSPLYYHTNASNTSLTGDGQETQMLTAPLQAPDRSTTYNVIAQAIQQTSHSLRIHRLLFYLCRQRWVKDDRELERSHIPDLVHELHTLAPTADHLSKLVTQFVQTLNKRTEYSFVANILISKMSLLYADAGCPETAALIASGNPQSLPDGTGTLDVSEQDRRYHEVATDLDRDPNALRIKKLMLYTCRMQWESNPEVLANHLTATLVQELHSLALNPGQLHTALYAVVRTLSKPTEYEFIANIILAHLNHLYSTGQTIGRPTTGIAPTVPMEPEQSPDRLLPEASQPMPELAVPSPQQLVTVHPVSSSGTTTRTPSLLDIRLEIIRYNNPLRVKILLFSALYSDFQFNSQDWLNLKMHELAGLIRTLLSTCPVYTELEVLLYAAARRSAEMEESLEIAESIVKCLRPFYLYGNPSQVLAAEETTDKTQIALETTESTQLNFTALPDDVTCHIGDS